MMKDTIYGAVVIAAILGAVAFFGYSPFLKTVINQITAGSPAGTTFGTAKTALVAINLASPGTNGTSTSILNGDAGDRYITSVKIGCENLGTSQTAYAGGGLSALQFKFATSSTANPVALTNTNLIGGGAFTVGTSTGFFAEASSTASGLASGLGGTTNVIALWPTGTYMSFSSNATNTAACSIGVEYFNS